MKNELLPTLRKELEKSFGRKVASSRDCLQMVDDIYQKTGYTINVNTLRRFFGLVKSSYSASPSTLFIFLKYCGFNSPEEFESISEGKDPESNIKKEELHHFLVSIFKNLPVDENNNTGIDSFILQTVSFLERHPDLIDKFQRDIAGTPAGQYYYFERAVNMDRLNGFYGDGLRYYLRSRNSTEAIAFVHSIQLLRHWLSDRPELMEKSMAGLSAINVNNSYPGHIMARCTAARLLYNNYKGESIDRVMAEASRYYTAVIAKSSNAQPDFELIVAEALILTGHAGEAGEYLKKGKSRLAGLRKNSEIEQLFSMWDRLVNTRKVGSIKALIGVPRQNQGVTFSSSPLTKKYYTLLTGMNNPQSRKANFRDLVVETGFTRFA